MTTSANWPRSGASAGEASSPRGPGARAAAGPDAPADATGDRVVRGPRAGARAGARAEHRAARSAVEADGRRLGSRRPWRTKRRSAAWSGGTPRWVRCGWARRSASSEHPAGTRRNVLGERTAPIVGTEVAETHQADGHVGALTSRRPGGHLGAEGDHP